jgi:hypothetical protein
VFRTTFQASGCISTEHHRSRMIGDSITAPSPHPGGTAARARLPYPQRVVHDGRSTPGTGQRNYRLNRPYKTLQPLRSPITSPYAYSTALVSVVHRGTLTSQSFLKDGGSSFLSYQTLSTSCLHPGRGRGRVPALLREILECGAPACWFPAFSVSSITGLA